MCSRCKCMGGFVRWPGREGAFSGCVCLCHTRESLAPAARAAHEAIAKQALWLTHRTPCGHVENYRTTFGIVTCTGCGEAWPVENGGTAEPERQP